MKSKSFVDKVYDAYIKEDYSYGDNNLNPKREIKQMSLKNTDDQLNRILASIQRKVTEISMKYPVNTFEVNEHDRMKMMDMEIRDIEYLKLIITQTVK